MKIISTLLTALFLLSGCTTTSAPMTEYRLLSTETKMPLNAQGCKDKSIKIGLAFGANSLMAQKMKYAKDEFGEYAFSNSQWSEGPNTAITQEILQSVRASNLFANVQNYKSRSISKYILESSVEEFIQYFDTEENSSYSVIRISFTLVDTKSSDVIQSLIVSKKVDVKELNARGGVKALSEALTQILQEKNLWLNEVCK